MDYMFLIVFVCLKMGLKKQQKTYILPGPIWNPWTLESCLSTSVASVSLEPHPGTQHISLEVLVCQQVHPIG